MKKILFVCVENSCRSQMAEAFGHIHKSADLAVYSAGSNPSGQVNPRAVEVMAERDYPLNQHRSEGLDSVSGLEFDAVVTMGCGDRCSDVVAHRRLDWPLPDPKHLPLEQFRQVRDEIETRVIDLIASL
ncbi:arsenate reductase ArsC [bacterium SCSIO 12696]|nr:arsenate reductase ArsC [bacterium SCSIO 12696]